MEYKYPENIRFKITNLEGIKNQRKFPKMGSCSNDCEPQGELKIGEYGALKHKNDPNERFQYYLVLSDEGLESDYMSEREIEIMMGKELVEELNKKNDTYNHVKQSKPPLGVMPKQIYELQRIQDLCRALYEYSHYDDSNLESMIKWSEELTDRLKTLK